MLSEEEFIFFAVYATSCFSQAQLEEPCIQGLPHAKLQPKGTAPWVTWGCSWGMHGIDGGMFDSNRTAFPSLASELWLHAVF